MQTYAALSALVKTHVSNMNVLVQQVIFPCASAHMHTHTHIPHMYP
jgi:hypothetical protein